MSEIDATLGEWSVRHDELEFGKKLVDGGTFGHDVFAGRWHGSVIVHSFKLAEDDVVTAYLVRSPAELQKVLAKEVLSNKPK